MKKKRAITLIVLGLAVGILAIMIQSSMHDPARGTGVIEDILKFVGIIGSLVYICGLCLFAKAKGRNPCWGLTGLLCLVGGITVAIIKERRQPQT